MYDRETIERARHRGRAYLCLACVQLKKKRVADELGKLEDHIVRNHVELERVPFYCQLCTFKCMKEGQYTSHLSQNKRHMLMCSQRQIQDSSPWKVVSPNPYVITETDMQKLSQEESLRFFMEGQTRQLSPLDEGLSKIIAGTLDADLTEDTLKTCAIPMTSTGTIQIPVPATTATSQPDRGIGQTLPSFQGMQKTAIQGVPPQQWPANSSLAMFQHPMTAQTWNPLMMSLMPRPATQLTTQPSQLAAQKWNPAMLPLAPQTAIQPLTQPSPFAGPMWTSTSMSMMQQPATQPMMQQPATQPTMQQPATPPMVPAPASQPTTQQPAVRIWNPAMMDTIAASQRSFKPVTPTVDTEQAGGVGNQTVTVLTMGLDL